MSCIYADRPYTGRIPTCEAGYFNCPNSPTCEGYAEYKPPTNADRIRSMSDGEMAKRNVIMVRSSSPHKLDYALVYRCSDKYETDDYCLALKHELDWLRKPSEE